MSMPADAEARPVRTAQLRTTLEALLSRYFGARRRIVRFESRPSEYSSSFALEELDISLDDGITLELMFKDLGWQALMESARGVKPSWLYNPLREIEVYQTILARSRLGTAACYGAVADPGSRCYWLFLERVPGLRLCHVGDFAIWQQVASHLAVMRNGFAGEIASMEQAQRAHFLRYDGDFYRVWLHRAREFVSAKGLPDSKNDCRGFEKLAERYDRVIERLMALPATFIHGEFYPSNILIHQTGAGVRVCPVDWEMAALGPGLLDLASLTAGKWTDEQKKALVLAYSNASPPGRSGLTMPEDLRVALECCWLHLAVQLLGLSPQWSPPAEYARNWLREALDGAERLGIL
jgi:hypothetical protein